MRLSRRVLNRTLLQRQHLLARSDLGPLAMVEHLLGLQAQDPLPPYLSLAARLTRFDPLALSETLEARTTVRVLLLRGTLHVVTAADAHGLRPFVQPMLDKVTRTSATSKPAAHLPRADLEAAGRGALAGGPLPLRALGERLATTFPGVPPTALANTVRELTPLVQVPPRGLWRRSGGVVYEHLDTWLGAAGAAHDPADVARRYLRAFGPATAADLTAWSGATGARAVLDALGDELVRHQDERGRALHDLDGLPLADEDTPAPVRLLGTYDNLWLSHAGRDRVTPDPAKRARWMGSNGGVGSTVFVNGELEGLWRVTGAGRLDVELFRDLGAAERADLDAEVGRLESLLAVPPG
jgi:hypothetical protein